MTSSDDSIGIVNGLLLVLCLVSTILAIGLGLRCITITDRWESDAIEHNAAYYDAKTGDFKWNDEKTEGEKDK